jgi:hypothetical protein
MGEVFYNGFVNCPESSREGMFDCKMFCQASGQFEAATAVVLQVGENQSEEAS